MIEDLMRAFAFRKREPFRASRGSEHDAALRAGELDRRDAHAAACAVHENGFAGSRVREMHERDLELGERVADL